MLKQVPPPFHVLIPAAGSGMRTGLSVPKQYRKIAGKMILRHTIEKFLPLQGLKSLQVIIDPQHEALYHEAVRGLDLPDPILGAKTRKQSVFNGLSRFGTADQKDIVLIHDAARPFVTYAAILRLLDEMHKHTAATLTVPLTDTIVDLKYNPVNRDHLRAVQTPQAFQIALIKQAHIAFKNDDRFTDDAGLIAALGEDVLLVEGDDTNFKITSSEDLALAEKILTAPQRIKTGLGFDVHAFDPAPATSIRLGGIDIPHTQKLLGHSDADVILHAITDALLGAANEGDIGHIFSPSDPQWKDADSEIFLKEAHRRIHQKNGIIQHIDVMVLCESPKIAPHRDAMQNRIAKILNLPITDISIKATTMERMGFIGREEGIAAQAIATVSFPF